MIKHKNLVKSTIHCLLILVMIAGNAQGQHKLSKVSVSDNITIKIPRDFIEMSDQDMWQRSSSYRKATALYTDLDRIVELSVNNAFSRWEEGDIRILQNVYKASIQEIFDEVEFSIEEIRNVNGRDFAVFEFISKIKGDPGISGASSTITKYYYIQYTIVDGGTLVFNFSCQDYAREEWNETAGKIMASVKIK